MINQSDNRPYCPSCKKHVAPQIVNSRKTTGPTIIVDTPGPIDHVVRNQQDIQTMYCSQCGNEVLKVHYCKQCNKHTAARTEYHRTSGFSWDQSSMAFCTSCNQQVAGPEKSGCFIATATMGSPNDPAVLALRYFRDNTLLASSWGQRFVDLYCRLSPPIADWIRDKASVRSVLKWVFILPAYFTLRAFKLMNRKKSC